MICTQANHTHDDPELMSSPLSLESLQNLTCDLPIAKSICKVPPTHKRIPINTIWTYLKLICFENTNGSGRILGYVPLKMYNYTLFDSDDCEFTPELAISDYSVTSYNAYVIGGNSGNNTTQS